MKKIKPTGIRCKPGETWIQYDEGHLLSSHGRWYAIKSGVIMKQFPNTSGYMRVKLSGKQTFTHIKVVEFFGDKNGSKLDGKTSLFAHGLSIDHLDRNKLHNGSMNLELVTHQENCIRRSQWAS